MKNPCTKECPDRAPGCHCEKREAWKWQQEQIKEAKKRESLIDSYVRARKRKIHQAQGGR